MQVNNPSAWQIPAVRFTRRIGRTVYTVTGSFEGTENLVRKLERICAKKFADIGGDSDDRSGQM